MINIKTLLILVAIGLVVYFGFIRAEIASPCKVTSQSVVASLGANCQDCANDKAVFTCPNSDMIDRCTWQYYVQARPGINDAQFVGGETGMAKGETVTLQNFVSGNVRDVVLRQYSCLQNCPDGSINYNGECPTVHYTGGSTAPADDTPAPQPKLTLWQIIWNWIQVHILGR